MVARRRSAALAGAEAVGAGPDVAADAVAGDAPSSGAAVWGDGAVGGLEDASELDRERSDGGRVVVFAGRDREAEGWHVVTMGS